MTVCQFFLQGRCRFGDRCWNEHPGARGAGGARPPPASQQLSASNRRGWNASSQRYSNVIQPSSFSRSTPWGGSRGPDQASFGSSTGSGFGAAQRPFASLSSGDQDEQKLLEGIVKDVEVWESSGQWMFSAYSPLKTQPPVAGFTDISPEELRLEYHNFLTSNNLQSYLNSVQQLITQWKNRINQLKTINKSNRVALLPNLNNGVNQAAPALGFGSTQARMFGSSGSSKSVQNFSFKTSPGFAPATSGSPSVFGTLPALGAVPSAGSAVSASTPAFGFGKPQITSAASFSFKTPAASGFGSAGFSAAPTSLAGSPFGAAMALAFGGGTSVAGFGSPGSQSHTAFSKPSNNIFGSSSIPTSLPVSNVISATDKVLFTPKDQLTQEELEQFQSKKFTLGKIPLKPPPVELIHI
uniref:nucleoporin NUP42 n=1 Tax=Jaculus jaculus TaxID=51337 RepID=UPI001E1B5D65|nr:nucleoporin NUP42 [Jaculus jaculus]